MGVKKISMARLSTKAKAWLEAPRPRRKMEALREARARFSASDAEAVEAFAAALVAVRRNVLGALQNFRKL